MPDLIDRVRTQGRRPRRSQRTAIAALAAVLLVAGCGGGDDDADATATSSSTDTTASTTTSTTEEVSTTTAAPEGVCDLITPVDIEAALQVTVEPGLESTEGDATVCAYESADGTSQVTISRYEPVGDLLGSTLAGDPDAESVTGVADGAVLQLKIGSITTVRRQIGLVIKALPAPTEAALVQLARVGAGKL